MHIPGTRFLYAPDRTEEILRLCNLKDYADLLKVFNRAAGNPYHNNLHAITVMEDTFTYLLHSFESNPSEVSAALTAAIFHDAMHSGGLQPDSINIEEAVKFVMKINSGFSEVCDLDLVVQAIKCTCFDGAGFPVEPSTGGERALRDADLSTTFHIFEERGRLLAVGLFDEINRIIIAKGKPAMTVDVFMEKQVAFMKNATWYTPMAQTLSDETLDLCLEEMHKVLAKERP